MNITKIKLENFLSYQSAELDLTKRGVVLVSGVVHDSTMSNSNGAGKSALLPESIIFALSGKTLRGTRGSGVVNDQIGKNCLVTLWGDVNGQEFVIRRPQNNDKIQSPEIEVGGSMYQGDANVRDVVTNQILGGISIETLIASQIFGKGKNSMFFSQLDDSARKKVLDEILGLTYLDSLFWYTQEKLKDVEEEIVNLNSSIHSTESVLASLVALRTDTRVRIQEWEAERTVKAKAIKAKIKAISNSKKIAQETLLGFKDRLEENRDLIQDLYEQTKPLHEALKASEEEELSNSTQALLLQERIVTVSTRLAKMKTGLESNTCSYCMSKVNVFTLTEIIEDSELELRNLQSQYNTIPSSGSISKPLKEAMSLHMLKIKAVEDTIDEISFMGDKQVVFISGCVKEIEAQDKSLKELMKEEGPSSSLLDKIESMCAEHEESLQEDNASLVSSCKKKQLLDILIVMFGNKGVKSFILDGVVPNLNKAASRFAEILTDGELTVTFDTQTELKSGDKREKISLTVNVSGKERSYQECSDGQKRRVDIISTLALGELASNRINQRINFCVLDEVFDGLDETGLARVMKLLKELEKERESIFVITHDDRLSSFFDSTILVENINGVSSLKAA